jgi:hypothetical protein
MAKIALKLTLRIWRSRTSQQIHSIWVVIDTEIARENPVEDKRCWLVRNRRGNQLVR